VSSRTALVTGASRGIGRAIAAALARRGWDVVGTSRTPAEAPGVRMEALDLADEASIQALASSLGDLDLIVHNAGGSQIGPIEEVPVEAIRALFERNLFGAVRLTQLLLPRMRARGSGRILFVSSFAGVTPVPFLSIYAATKAALIAVGRGLRQEVRASGILVSVIAPFDIHTSIPLELSYRPDSPYLAGVRRVREVRDRSLAEGPEPDVVANLVLKIVGQRRPRAFYPAGRRAGLQAFLLKHLPDGLVERIVRRMFKVDG
jgi:NAD(P)-dependent dehydrogenase (short-subunit alcohol dehydrogenase family)